MIKGQDNLNSGYHKSGTYLTGRESVLKKVAFNNLDPSISFFVGKIFLEQIPKKPRRSNQSFSNSKKEKVECRFGKKHFSSGN